MWVAVDGRNFSGSVTVRLGLILKGRRKIKPNPKISNEKYKSQDVSKNSVVKQISFGFQPFFGLSTSALFYTPSLSIYYPVALESPFDHWF